MIILTNTFTDSIISRHRTVKAAVAARIKHAKAIRKRSPNSYTTYSITDDAGNSVDRDSIEHAEAIILGWK
jgi:hypothetical protein